MDEKLLYHLEYLGLTVADMSAMINPFHKMTDEEKENPALHLVRLMRNPDYFYFTCKYLLNIDLAPFQCVILKELWTHRFPMLIGCRGLGKSFLLGLYAVLRALLVQGSKIVITGSGFRQAKTVFTYATNIWYKSPILQSIAGNNTVKVISQSADQWVFRVGDSTITALPVGDGSKIRGQRANVIIGDEFASIPKDIFETVIAGFGVVNLDPINKAKERAKIRVKKRQGNWSKYDAEDFRLNDTGNQTIISGTAYYQFNHFADYWKRWKDIIESKGDKEKLRKIFGGEVMTDLDPRDYCVIRIPVHLLPEGYMDGKTVTRQKLTIHSGTFQNEYGAVFSADSMGFFKRTLIESCVTTNPVTPCFPGSEPIQFKATTRGNITRTYVMGVDPASEKDNFSIVIVECHEDHRRIVYCWTTDKQRFRAKLERKLVEDHDYYGHCARKIRQLLRVFPCEIIALDTQGGGVAVMEALQDPDKMLPGEKPILPITADHPLSDGKERDTDDWPGLHIIEPVSFARAEWVSNANHGMKKDFEDKCLLFPIRDTIALYEAGMDDEAADRKFDTLEECVDEIDDLKDELATIVHSQTPGTLRDKWDTPETKSEGSKKGRLRKDRYSSLLMASYAARRLQRQPEAPEYEAYGGFTNRIVGKSENEEMYVAAPDWFKKQIDQSYDDYGWTEGGVNDW